MISNVLFSKNDALPSRLLEARVSPVIMHFCTICSF